MKYVKEMNPTDAHTRQSSAWHTVLRRAREVAFGPGAVRRGALRPDGVRDPAMAELCGGLACRGGRLNREIPSAWPVV